MRQLEFLIREFGIEQTAIDGDYTYYVKRVWEFALTLELVSPASPRCTIPSVLVLQGDVVEIHGEFMILERRSGFWMRAVV
jgi:hypothetical protein